MRCSARLSSGVSFTWVLAATASGVTAAIAIGMLGDLLYGDSSDNWSGTVSATLLGDPQFRTLPPAQLFPVLAIPAALFSPLAEELVFRGVFHDSILTRVGRRAALTITGVLFGFMHLFHHGISMGSTGVEVRVISGVIWMLLTVGLSVLFAVCRLGSTSIWSAVLCHAAFNVTMVGVHRALTTSRIMPSVLLKMYSSPAASTAT